MSEQAFRKTVLGILRRYGFAEPLEAPLFSGVPDLLYAFKPSSMHGRGSGFLELKHEEHWPVMHRTPVRFKFRPMQARFIIAYTEHGGTADLLLRVDNTVMAVRGVHIRKVMQGLTRTELRELPGYREWDGHIIEHEFVQWLAVSTRT